MQSRIWGAVGGIATRVNFNGVAAQRISSPSTRGALGQRHFVALRLA